MNKTEITMKISKHKEYKPSSTKNKEILYHWTKKNSWQPLRKPTYYKCLKCGYTETLKLINIYQSEEAVKQAMSILNKTK